MAKNRKNRKEDHFPNEKGSPEAARDHLLRCRETLLRLCDVLNRGSLDLESYRAFTEFFVWGNYPAIRKVLEEDAVLCRLITGSSFVDDSNKRKREEVVKKIVVSMLMAEVARSIEERFDQGDEELLKFKDSLDGPIDARLLDDG
ncbi:MAG: hypothetical protein UR98_C0002G0027 [Parcubacteria group bacterium GW2011_GWA1_36_12]|nr:MAG: hypothetical protein UR98_C0002G0027 [Parcubacteria group bacterium GW2011_GWA1_36_12]